MTQTRVAISGFSSNSGKTTLLCRLLEAFPGWEAIKVTRGHYRSCGKDPHACCVSHMLGAEPLVRSGREETYQAGKDTGRYWDAGASNVHWLIVTDRQVEEGIGLALARVRAPGVFIEGTSFLNYMEVDFALMAATAGHIKPSARRVLTKASALYLFDNTLESGSARPDGHTTPRLNEAEAELLKKLPVYTSEEIPLLVDRLRAIHAAALPRAGRRVS